ncbi:hypothetical protein [Alicyclobacillus sp. ALC3]|uniref:hypothetical protein n=1 Tax=Alicyclobacillus sp. ALC3 TaxID=2796143 RepID=UPI0023799EA3|nr:hypothetical protein [Alicyclobacillus sp. ALC3]WDL97506.1 hypothetical protein JC200_01890 [Alicyclobacillus sp. ALC3]
MAISADAWAELGQSAERVVELTKRIGQVQWFRRENEFEEVGKLTSLVQRICQTVGLSPEVEVKYLSIESLEEFVRQYDIDRSPLWQFLRGLPDEVRAGLEQSNRLDWLVYAADTVPTSVFHSAFDGAFARYGALGQEVILFAVSTAMWISGAVMGVALTADTTAPGSSELALRLLELCEYGVLPLGQFDGVFYLA